MSAVSHLVKLKYMYFWIFVFYGLIFTTGKQACMLSYSNFLAIFSFLSKIITYSMPLTLYTASAK